MSLAITSIIIFEHKITDNDREIQQLTNSAVKSFTVGVKPTDLTAEVDSEGAGAFSQALGRLW